MIKIGEPRHILGSVFLTFSLTLMSFASVQASISVQATVDQNEVDVGEPFTYVISVSAKDQLLQVGEPRLPDLVGLQLLGKNEAVESRHEYVNGQIEAVTTQKYIYTLSAESKGKVKIGEAEVVVNGKSYSTKGIQISANPASPGKNKNRQQDPFNDPFFDEADDLFSQIIKRRMFPNSQGGADPRDAQPSRPINEKEAFFLDVEVDKKEAFVGEQITASFYLYTRNLIRDIDPLKYPTFKAFWKEDIEIPTRLNFEEVVVNGLAYKRALLAAYAIFPIKPGSALIDPYKAKSTVAVLSGGFGSFGMGQTYTFTKTSPEIQVKVHALPVANVPKSFSGAVGNFDVKSSVASQKFAVGQPFSFKIRVDGRGNAKNIDLPPLDLPPSVELYDTKVDSKFFKDGTSYKEFELLLIPRQEGELNIPSIKIGVFDPTRRLYHEKETSPVRITIGKGAPGESKPSYEGDPNKGQDGSSVRDRVIVLPGPVVSEGWRVPLDRGTRNFLWLMGYLILSVALYLKFRRELGGQRRPSLQRLVDRRLKDMKISMDQRDWRKFGTQGINLFSLVLGELVGDGGASGSVEQLLGKLPPTVRQNIEDQFRKQVSTLETLSFAPEHMVGNINSKDELSRILVSVKELLEKLMGLMDANSDSNDSGPGDFVRRYLRKYLSKVRVTKASFLVFTISCAFSSMAMASPAPLELFGSQLVTPKMTWKESGLSIDVRSKKMGLKEMARLKEAQLRGDHKSCLQLITPLFGKMKAVEAWLSQVELDCAVQSSKDGGKEIERFGKAIARAEGHPDWHLYRPFAEPLRKKLKDAYIQWIEVNLSRSPVRAWEGIEKLLKLENYLSTSERARVLKMAGEVAFLEQNMGAAHTFFSRSLLEEESAEVRVRLRALESLLGLAKSEDITPKKKDIKDERLEASRGEQDLVERMSQALRQGDIVPAIEDGLLMMSQYPGGVRASWASDRIYEAYTQIEDRDESKYKLLHGRILNLMKKADPNRLQVWAQSAFRSENYEDALVFAKESIDKFRGSVPTKLLYLQARSAYFLGDLSLANTTFNTIIEKHSGSDEAVESMFYSALLSIRKKEYANAAAQLERLLVVPRSSNLEIKARYWLWRSLQNVDPPRASREGEFLMVRFPLTYYGLIARSEILGKITNFDNSSGGTIQVQGGSRRASLWSVESERESFRRMVLLAEAGWYEEARMELENLPIPADAKSKVQVARLWASVFGFPKAISVLNRAWDENPQLIDSDHLRIGFPLEFEDLISEEAKLRRLDSNLVRSLIRQESAFSIRAVSSSGALGLMQMIPSTVSEVAQDLKIKGVRLPEDMFNPKTNVKFCTYYLAKVLGQFSGNVPWALAGYNAGPARVKKWMKIRGLNPQISALSQEEMWFDELPWSETQGYVKAILRNLLIYRYLDTGQVQVSGNFWTQPMSSL